MVRNKSLEEASRDTKIKPSALQALEDEDFDSLGGDVYTRAFLRNYSQYLGLDPDKVVGLYAERAGELEPTAPPPPAQDDIPATPATIGAGRHRGSWIIAGGVTLIVVIAAGLLGLFSGNKSVPPPVQQPTSAPSQGAPGPRLTVAIVAGREVDAVITVDGQTVFSGTLLTGEARSYAAMESVSLEFSKGGVVSVTVDGKDLGSPGSTTSAYSQTFYAASPAPSPSSAPSTSPSARGGSPSTA
jgi:cytoskeletal protein RodZ